MEDYLIYSEEFSELGRHLLEKLFGNKDAANGIGFRLIQKKLEFQG